MIIGDKFKSYDLKSLVNLTKMTAILLFIMSWVVSPKNPYVAAWTLSTLK